MRLQTPEKIRTLQRKLYLKAKAEPDFRFYLLYDKVYREDILFHAYRLARSNKGAPGVDGQSFAEIEAMGLEGWLSGIRDDLRAKTYRPEPVRRAMVPKPGGGERPLGIPTIRDRVVQGAVKLVIEPIFEADLEPSAYGYRPKRSAGDAVQAVHKLLCRGYTDVVDADLSKYFDTIPHAELMQSVARRIVDRNVLRLIKLWLKTPVEETDGDGKRRMTGGRGSTRGTPQGGIVSPLLAALYMNRFLRYWRITGQGTRFRAEVVNYADDLVILSRGHAREALAWTRQVMIRERWPNVAILLRGDSGFARENLMRWCEGNAVDYVFGLARNDVLLKKAQRVRGKAAMAMIETGQPVRAYGDFHHITKSRTWARPRRVIAKVEHKPGHQQRCRFLVTSLDRHQVPPRELYEDTYCPRGDMENRIKDCQLDLFANRMSAHAYKANQLRLLLAAFAYVLIDGIRRVALKKTTLAKAVPNTIRLKLLKVGAKVINSVRRIKLSLPDACPYKDLFFKAHAALAPP